MYVICMYLFIWMLLLYVRARECMCKCVFGRCPATSLCFLCCLLQCGRVMSYVILLFMLSFAMHVGYVLLSYFAFYVVFCKAYGWCPAYAILLSSSSTIWKKKLIVLWLWIIMCKPSLSVSVRVSAFLCIIYLVCVCHVWVYTHEHACMCVYMYAWCWCVCVCV